uniref:NADAR domain-containing protein n=1 Tax=viral metagenome TaxID=1070528 RepID=A0A6C0H9J7_9ZZZZ
MNNLYYEKYNKYKLKYLNAIHKNKLYGGMEASSTIIPRMPGYDDIHNQTDEDVLINSVIAFYGSNSNGINKKDLIDEYYGFECLCNFYPCKITININTSLYHRDKYIIWTFQNAEAAFQAVKFNKILLKIKPSYNKPKNDDYKKVFDECFDNIDKYLEDYKNYSDEDNVNGWINLIYFFTLTKFTGAQIFILSNLLSFLIEKEPDCFITFNTNRDPQSISHTKNFKYGQDNGKSTYAISWMFIVLRIKFKYNETLKNVLLSTKNTFLIEHNIKQGRDYTWSDNNNGTGSNLLGLVLMLVRDEIMGTKEWTNYFADWLKQTISESEQLREILNESIRIYNTEMINSQTSPTSWKSNKKEINIDTALRHYNGYTNPFFKDTNTGIYLVLPSDWIKTVLKIATLLNKNIINIYDKKKELIKNLPIEDIKQFITGINI